MNSAREDPVLSALDSQLGCYRRLAKLAAAQHEFVQQGQTEQLLDVLARRQEVLNQIASFERSLAPTKGRWSSYLGELDETRRLRAEALLAETRRLLEEITVADRNDALVLQQRKLNIGRELGKTQTARVVNRSYAAAAYGTKAPRMDVQR